ncbi:hypothetical protein G6F56_005182 [Rhizopus delemar]|nr:hypothetical protein G6F56_005182 [Rhizopus delemar]
MRCAPSILNDKELKQEATRHIQKLVSNKSNSPSNTLRTINSMFESASKACHFDRERALIDWLQTCVSTAVELALDPTEKPYVGAESPKTETKTESKPGSHKSKGVKASKPKPKPVVDDDASWVEDDDEDPLGDSEDDYLPDDNDGDEAVVPGKETEKRKKPAKKDQRVPKTKEETKLSLLKEGAGFKAVHKYFNDMETSTNSVLTSGYFAKAFFFPSKDSFNANNQWSNLILEHWAKLPPTLLNVVFRAVKQSETLTFEEILDLERDLNAKWRQTEDYKQWLVSKDQWETENEEFYFQTLKLPSEKQTVVYEIQEPSAPLVCPVTGQAGLSCPSINV